MRQIIMIIALASALFSLELGFSSNYEASLKKAQKEKKDVYMLITSDDCQWCRKFEAKTLSNKKFVRKIQEKYVIVHVTRDVDDIPSRFFAKRVPKHYFLTNKGEEIYSFLGYWNVDDFSSFLKDVQKKKVEGLK